MWRYEAKLSSDNAQIEADLIALSEAHPQRGFGLTYLHLRNVRGKPSEATMGQSTSSHTLANWAAKQGIALWFTQTGNPQQNAYIERFKRTMRYELLNQNLFTTIEQAQDAATQWQWIYNQDRPSMALNGLTPIQCLEKYKTIH
jgi:putative transposase